MKCIGDRAPSAPLRALALILLLGSAAAAPGRSPVHDETIATASGPRHFIWTAPPHLAGAAPPPLVMLLHGHGGSAAQAMGRSPLTSPLSAWLEIAARDGIVVVALDGLRGRDGLQGWHDCRRDVEANPDTDDVDFVARVIDDLSRRTGIDRRRVYAMGMSNGAMMSYRLALELSRPLAAIAAVAGGMADDGACAIAQRPLSVLIIHGTDDPLVPYRGGRVGLDPDHPRGTVMGAETAAALWRKVDGLGGEPAIVEFPRRAPGAPTHATRRTWGADPQGLQVALIRIDGGGHAEPSLARTYGALYRHFAGRQNGDFESAEEAWRFFRGKAARDPADTEPPTESPTPRPLARQTPP